MSENAQTATGLPKGWTVGFSRKYKMPYYVDPATDKAIWDIPPGTNEETLRQHLRSITNMSTHHQDSKSGDPVEVACLHLLQKHRESRRPVDPNGNEVTRTRQQAQAELTRIMESEVRGDLTAFTEAAKRYSECSSGKRGGDLGPFTRGKMQKEFEEAAFDLQPGQFSKIVSTGSGEHIIYRYK